MEEGSLKNVNFCLESSLANIYHKANPLCVLCATSAAKDMHNRDVRPENFLFNSKGDVKLAEFGMFMFSSGLEMGFATVVSVIRGEQPTKAPLSASKEFRYFVACCLHKDPSKRWTAEQLLHHVFVLQNCSSSSCCN
ncbi:Mitogen-activated protein kinase kinase [Sesamum angolense]|uniref:Mitogen-activated protein kinase kinase n=1 Tax=Sesamum angolense TaxID=2727404 RepID=A0AAE2C101_9LAMI|nr:Mitogen-activated protein kinase kinase [Sesamum angolense]